MRQDHRAINAVPRHAAIEHWVKVKALRNGMPQKWHRVLRGLNLALQRLLDTTPSRKNGPRARADSR